MGGLKSKVIINYVINEIQNYFYQVYIVAQV